MYAQFKEAIMKKDRRAMEKFIENAETEELTNMLTEKINSPNMQKMLDEFLQGFIDSELSQTKKRKFVEMVLKSLCNAKGVTSSQMESIVNRIVLNLSSYSKVNLVKLTEFCLERIRLNDDNFMSWKDMLPLILQVLEEEKYISYKGDEVTGPEYKSLIVKTICNNRWQSEILSSLAKMFGEITLEKGDHELVVKALCHELHEVELSEIPPLVHQLLKLCSNQESQLLLMTLQKYFAAKYLETGDSQNMESAEKIDTLSLKEIQETESTVLYHIYQAAQLDHTRLKEFIFFLKRVTNAPEYILDPFLVAVLLSVSNVYEEQTFEILRQAIYRKIQDDDKRKSSAWLRTVLSDDWRIVDVIENVITNSTKDRYVLLKGLVEFAFVLMERDNRMKDDEHQMCDIGIRIIQRLIRKRHEIGTTVLQKLTERIVSGGSAITQYTECLSYISRKLTIVVIDAQAWVVTLLEQLMMIPGDAARQVLHAILPLMQVSVTIRDTLVLILRKALYRKGTHTRQMAVMGFLQLLKTYKIKDLSALSQSGQSSSTSVSSSTSIFSQVTLEKCTQAKSSNPRCNATLCHEVLSILKRCFTHEAEIRTNLYRGLYDAVVMNPELSEYVMDMLMTHFDIYYEHDVNVKPPLKFHICSDINGAEAVLQEPIGELIYVMQRIYIKTASKNSLLLDKVSITLESLCNRMAQVELEHFGLDESTDLHDNVPKSQQKLHILKLAISVYEALMAYRIGGWSTQSVNVSQSLNSLFKNYNELIEFSKRSSKSKKGDGKNKKDPNDTTLNKRPGRPVTIKCLETIMNLEAMYKMLCLLYESHVPWATKDQSTLLKKKVEFHHYILQTTIHLIQTAKVLKNSDLLRHKDSHLKVYLDIGLLLYKHMICGFDRICSFCPQTAVLGLECFKELCDLICTSFASDLEKFFGHVCRTEASEGLNAQIQQLLQTFRGLLEAYFEQEKDDDPTLKKIPIIILDTMFKLLSKREVGNSKENAVFVWLKQMTETTEMETSVAVKFINLLTMIEERDQQNGSTVDELCIELCGKLGTIDKDENSIAEGFKCLTEASAVQTHAILSNAIKTKLDNASWLLMRLKSEQCMVSVPGLSDDSAREQIREKERSLCRQLCYVSQMLRSLATAAIEPGSNTDMIFKNFQQLYKLLSLLTKYFHNKSTSKNPAFQSVKFIQLVDLAGKSLTVVFYNFITHTEENQNTRRRKSDNYAQRNKVIKETKVIPNVVLAVENFRKDIMNLGVKTGIPLENHVKHSITRDYRIKNPVLIESLEKLGVSLQVNTQNSNHGENDVIDRDHESEDESPAVKRKRRRTGADDSI